MIFCRLLFFSKLFFSKKSFRNTIKGSNSLNPNAIEAVLSINQCRNKQNTATRRQLTPKIYTGLRKASDKEKQSSGHDEVKKRPLNVIFMAISDKICCTLAPLEGCVFNRGSFACKFVQGDMQLAT